MLAGVFRTEGISIKSFVVLWLRVEIVAVYLNDSILPIDKQFIVSEISTAYRGAEGSEILFATNSVCKGYPRL